MRTEVQNRIYDVCRTGTFAKVSYDTVTNLAQKSTTDFLVPEVVVGEISSSPSKSIVHGARDGRMGLADWQMEARLKFTSEVDTYYFLTEELRAVVFTYENTRIKISVGTPVAQPPRHGSHNGTEIVLTFTITTRR